MSEYISKQALLDRIKEKMQAIERVHDKYTGYHKRYLTGQYSALVDLEQEVIDGLFDVRKEE